MTTPAGWYDDGSGRQRWWDGQQWTEHFAPEAAAPTEPEAAAAAEEPAVTDVPSVDDTVIRPSDEAVVSPTAPDASVPSTPTTDSADPSAFSAPGESAPTTPLGDDLSAYAAPAAPAYPAAAPAYPAAAPGQTASGYPGSAPAGYPAAAPYGQPVQEGPKKLSVLGLVGLGLSALGTILVFIPVVGFVGFILLAAGFIVSLISLFLKGKKWPGITGLILAVVGTIIGVLMSFVYLFALAQGVSDELENFPSSSPSIEATEPGDGDSDSTDVGVRPTSAEVAEGLAAIFTSGAEGYTDAQISCLADLFVASDLDNETLRTIADSEGTLTDVDAAYGFAEVLGDTEGVTACFML